MAENYTIKGQWQQTDEGQVYTAKAVAKTGRILAVANARVPLDVGFDLAHYLGEEGKRQVEMAAQSVAKGVADRSP